MNSYSRILLFAVMLLPLTIASTGGIGISVNYSYGILVPIIAKFAFKQNFDAYFYVLFLTISGVIGVLINSLVIGVGPDLIIRQLLSLVIALLPVIFLFCDLSKYYDDFKDAVLICSVTYSIYAVFNFLIQSSLGVVNPFEMKDVLSERIPDWPQRYILVLFAGFYFTFDKVRYRSKIFLFVRAIVLVAILITFLRAAYLSLIVSFLFFYLSKFSFEKKVNNPVLKRKLKDGKSFFRYSFLLLFLGIFFLNSDRLHGVSFILDYLFDSFYNLLSGSGGENVSDETRIDIFKVILSALTISPLTGFGGAGVYIFAPEYGSSHNQYFDFLIRFGIVGLLFFLYFNFRIFRYFWSREPFVIAISASYFVFGVAHETTKYSYGGVIFFYLLSLTYRNQLKER